MDVEGHNTPDREFGARAAALAAPFFAALDVMRRTQAGALGALGFAPRECDYRVLETTPRWRLRDYGGEGPSLLIVAAPIKRPYVWDLAPSVSVIRRCLAEGLHLYLLEWLPPEPAHGGEGLEAHVDGVLQAAAKVAAAGGTRPVLIGHSLGGTLAAIAAAVESREITALVLIGAPLCFARATSRFGDVLATMDASALADMTVVPGSFLTQVSAAASPETFVWSRLMDAATIAGDRAAMDLHARVEHWALDEAALPAALVREIFQNLYRDNRLVRGELTVHGRRIGPSALNVPVLAAANTADQVAPPAAMAPFLDAMGGGDARLIAYPGETGVVLQHLALLIGREAHARIWPEILAWMRARAAPVSRMEP